MTRVEKYREYRKEILNSFYSTKKETKKDITSKRVSSATMNKDTGNSLSVDEVLEAYELYETSEPADKKKHLSVAQKRQLMLLIIGVLISIGIIVALIIIGIQIFGGK